MIERGKYQSLTMINWNGFFARTFDIDDLVTTLSGGNGAGKSTTMAAFITSLIPDQTLLHFRNTTEAGSSQASRDKGLFGKLQPGVCYAMLDVVNSRKQRLLFGVKLQQVAGRDKKVDIKPFVVQGLDSAIKPTDLLVEAVSGSRAKVRQLNEIKQQVTTMDGVQFKAFNSVVEYHSTMFEMGVVPKKLRNSSDRSKFYRLIEASLYGGISSAITRSLRDYLLPQNGGVKKAFQDMESALRENRLTLEAIKTTKSDRDLFKHLITESTNYVASDYMRHSNDRKQKLEQILSLRQELFNTQKSIAEQSALLVNIQHSQSSLLESESKLEQDYQSASDYFQLVQNAIRQKNKIERYQQDLEELSEKLEEQAMVVEESDEQVAYREEQTIQAEDEVDSLKSQLADYQQALDIQQTRALQYQQAVKALTNAVTLLSEPTLTEENAHAKSRQLKQLEQSKTEALLTLKHKLDMASATKVQFEKGVLLVSQVVDDVNRDNLASQAKKVIARLNVAQSEVKNESTWSRLHNDLKKDIETQKKANQIYDNYLESYEIALSDDSVVAMQKEKQQLLRESSEKRKQQIRDQRNEKKYHLSKVEKEISQLEAHAPKWIQANEARLTLEAQLGLELTTHSEVMQKMQQVLEQERTQTTKKDVLATQRAQLDTEIEKLAAPGGSSDPRLKEIADNVGGVLLSEIYDDISLEDAPYFSAMYGPSRHAIVVSDLSEIKDKLTELTDCPEDLYLIEGDVDAFDDNAFAVEELQGAVCVQFNNRQIRYSRISDNSLFGRAAREQKLEQLRLEREDIVELYAKVAFDEQKQSRLYQSLSRFVEQHSSIAFERDPDKLIKSYVDERLIVMRQLANFEQQEQQCADEISASHRAKMLLDEITPLLRFINDDTLLIRFNEIEENLNALSDSKAFIKQYKQPIDELESLLSYLDVDPAQFDSLNLTYQQAEVELKQIKAQLFALEDVCERRQHFAFSDSVSMLNKSNQLSEQLAEKLVLAENLRSQCREALKSVRGQASQYNQVYIALKSAYQAKSETAKEFVEEYQELGVLADEGSEQRASQNKASLFQQLEQARSEKLQLEKRALAVGYESKAITKQRNKVKKVYLELRKRVVAAKASWCHVLHLAKEHDMQRRLYRRELAYKTADELRSMSDKSLGALRLAVSNNDDLRDALRASEENAYPERKVLFYIAVYQHLKERIRQDIIHTDDPVEAIEEMEIELARLTEELTHRENRLAISSDSVANIIKKTIVREQNRVRLLNQGLSNINFGQVNGVRLNVNIRESHQVLLSALAEQQEVHQDLFKNNRLTFSEAMTKMFQRVNPHVDMGQRSPQVLGEELLDYRNYLELSVEVNRATDGWLQAESGALSTGEAIGTGQSILLMVIQSWEDESRRLRSKDIIPCRLLFLDEAARLDSKSISTLFELCERLDMQLLIAAPENISPEKGTTYKLIRKVFKGHEHVHVVGLKGFAQANDQHELFEELVVG